MLLILKLPHSYFCLTELNCKIKIVVSPILTVTLSEFEIVLLSHRHCSEDIIWASVVLENVLDFHVFLNIQVHARGEPRR